MEPAKIDWNSIDSRFIEDRVYEHINAPKWVDFLSLDDQLHQPSGDDDAWFCRPDCNHPKTAEDFLKTPPLLKVPKSVTGGGGGGSFPFRELNHGDAKLKRRGQTQIQPQSSTFSSKKIDDDGENRNPNLSIPPPAIQQAKSLKEAIKSSNEKKKPMTTMITDDILNHITDFCNELKRLATRARERETEENMSEEKKKIQGEEEAELVKERKPLFELSQEKKPLGITKDKDKMNKIRRHDDGENTVPSLSLNLENVKHKYKGGEQGLLQIRTNPPSPQCFSAPFKTTTTPSKAPKSRLMERGILQEVKQNKDVKPGSTISSSSSITNVNNVMDGRQARALDVFWFFKPCTLSE